MAAEVVVAVVLLFDDGELTTLHLFPVKYSSQNLNCAYRYLLGWNSLPLVAGYRSAEETSWDGAVGVAGGLSIAAKPCCLVADVHVRVR